MNRVLALLLTWLLSAACHAAEADSLKAGVFSPPHPAPEFTLGGSNGTPLSLSLTVSIKAWHYTHLFILHVRNDGCKRTV